MNLSQTKFPEIPSKSPKFMDILHARAVSAFAQRPLQDETAIDVSRTLMQSAKYNLTKGRDSRASRRLTSAIGLLEEQQALLKSTDPSLKSAVSSENTYGQLAGMLSDCYICLGGIKYNRGRSDTHNLSKYKRLLRNFEGAIVDYTKAIEYVSINPSAYNSRGNAKYMLGKYEDAIADFDQAIFQAPECASAHYNRGDTKYHLYWSVYWSNRPDGTLEGAKADIIKSVELYQAQNQPEKAKSIKDMFQTFWL